jgi:hypothetical protein
MENWRKYPEAWQPDIDRSVAEYDEWYLAESPGMFAEARERAVVEIEQTMRVTNDFRSFGVDSLIARPGALVVARMCISPPMARDRFVGFSGANKSLVNTMERKGIIPARLRNGQEARQRELLRAYLEGEGFEESFVLPFEMPPGAFGFGRNVRVVRGDGAAQNLPVDCVVSPLDTELPLACVELKSAGDFTNVNKRRKEESDKHDALMRAHGENTVFLLQLFGYFGKAYLGFEASAGIDWTWDHRLSDFDPYFGIE